MEYCSYQPWCAASILPKSRYFHLKKLFKSNKIRNGLERQVLDQRCTLMCDVSAGRLGQAKVKRSGAAIVINVMTEFESDVFKKGRNWVCVQKRQRQEHILYN